MRHRRLAAIVAVVVGTATLVLGAVLAVSQFPRGLGVLACVLIAGACAWYGVVRRGIARVPPGWRGPSWRWAGRSRWWRLMGCSPRRS